MNGFRILSFIGLLLLSLTSQAANQREIAIIRNTLYAPNMEAQAALPEPTDVKSEPGKTDENQDIDVYYIVGGMRLSLRYPDNQTTQERALSSTVKWRFSVAGRICLGFDIKASTDATAADYCSDLAANTDYTLSAPNDDSDGETLGYKLYWEPINWDLGVSADIQITRDFNGATITSRLNGEDIVVPYPNNITHLRIANDTIRPAEGDEEPLIGSDIKMLEQMLWQLGGSPSDNPGIRAVRVPETQRDTFKVDNNSVGKMLSRFNYFSHYPITSADRFMHPEFIDTTHNGVVFSTIDELRKHWIHYMQAYQRLPNATRYSIASLVADALDGGEDGFDIAVPVFDGDINYPGGHSFGNGIIPATYSTEIHDTLQRYGTFERRDILKAMALQEGGGYQWGKDATTDEARRIIVGGYDEAGSKGFNQIQNKHTYGGFAQDGTDTAGCREVSAYSSTGESWVNHYDPRQNMVGKAVWLAKSNCGGSFWKAFATTSYTDTYISGDTILVAIHTGNVVDTVTNGNHTDDNYEKLAKGIGGYNQGINTFNENSSSWAGLLTRTSNTVEQNKAMKYAIEIMHNDYLPFGYRTYIWQGGMYPADLTDAEGNPDPRAGQAWCFGYGESEWISGATVVNDDGTVRLKKFSDYLDDANDEESLRVPCN